MTRLMPLAALLLAPVVGLAQSRCNPEKPYQGAFPTPLPNGHMRSSYQCGCAEFGPGGGVPVMMWLGRTCDVVDQEILESKNLPHSDGSYPPTPPDPKPNCGDIVDSGAPGPPSVYTKNCPKPADANICNVTDSGSCMVWFRGADYHYLPGEPMPTWGWWMTCHPGDAWEGARGSKQVTVCPPSALPVGTVDGDVWTIRDGRKVYRQIGGKTMRLVPTPPPGWCVKAGADGEPTTFPCE